MTDFLYSLLAFVLALSPLVFIHELGHYLMARAFGVKVDCFSIGFGPSLVSWVDRNGTKWQISALLFGGYVKMAGDDNVASSHGDAKCPDSLHAQAPWKRILVGAAGPGANYLFAFVLLIALMRQFGLPVAQTVIEKVAPQSIAEKYGFKAGQTIKKVNGKEVKLFEDFKIAIKDQTDLNIEVDQNGRTQKIMMDQVSSPLGITPIKEYTSVTLGKAVTETLSKMNPVASLKGMSLDAMGGPISIGHQAGGIFKEGMASFLFFMATISIALGFFNLLPIPLLDGGMMFFACIEAMRGRPLSEKMQGNITNFFGMMLISLFIFLSWKDLGRIPTIHSLLSSAPVSFLQKSPAPAKAVLASQL